MSGANGYEDYTYSNYFLGRNEFEGFYTRQLVMKEGAFKVHTDYLSDKIGKTDNWLGSINFTTTIPKKINLFEALPFKLPIRIFFDLGTYAEAWGVNPPTEKLLYDGGFQLSLLKDLINIYFPVVYSKSYRDYFKSVLNDKIFSKEAIDYFDKLFSTTEKVDFEAVLFPVLTKEKKLSAHFIPNESWISVNDEKGLKKLLKTINL